MTKAIVGWTAMNQERAQRILESYPEKRSTVMPLLYLASLEHGFVDDDAMVEVGEITGLTSAQVQSVASFYTMYQRRPVGKYLVSVCTSISCYLAGADDVLAAVEREAGALDGETSSDGTVSVEHVECIGACGGATALQVNYETVEGVEPDAARGWFAGWWTPGPRSSSPTRCKTSSAVGEPMTGVPSSSRARSPRFPRSLRTGRRAERCRPWLPSPTTPPGVDGPQPARLPAARGSELEPRGDGRVNDRILTARRAGRPQGSPALSR